MNSILFIFCSHQNNPLKAKIAQRKILFIHPFSLLRSCAAGRSHAGSTVWLTSAPACHSSRAACPKSGSPRLPYSPASARSSTEPGSWRRQRTPLPPPPWLPCRRARPRPPPALPLCLATLATSPAGRSCSRPFRVWGIGGGGTLGSSCGHGDCRVAERLQQPTSPAKARSPARLSSSKAPNSHLFWVRVSANCVQRSRSVKRVFLAGRNNPWC